MDPSLQVIREAQRILQRYLPVTTLAAAPSLSRSGATAHLKLEYELPTGSFKPRGALYALAVNLARRTVREVVASSTGNHGAAVAFAAREMGLPATIFLPTNPNPVKRARIAALGAHIVESGHDIADAFQAASAHASREGVYFLNDATDPDLPAGPATIACEILDQLPNAAAIYVPMGDTALIRGIAAAARQLSPKLRIVGVQAETAPSYYLSWKKGEAVSTPTCNTIADGLATRTPDQQNVAAIRALVDDVRLVTDQQMLDAIRHLSQHEQVVAEPAGAAATAAWLQQPARDVGQVVLLVSGGNVSPEVLKLALGS